MVGGKIKITLAAFFLLAGTGCVGYGLGTPGTEPTVSESTSSFVAPRDLADQTEPVLGVRKPEVVSTAIRGNVGLLTTPKLYLREVKINAVPSETQDTPA